MKSLYNEHDCYTRSAFVVDAKIQKTISQLFADLMAEGWNPREVSGIISSAGFLAASEYVLLRNIAQRKQEKLAGKESANAANN